MGWIGVDLGTQSVRAVLADADGTVLARAARPLTSFRDGSGTSRTRRAGSTPSTPAWPKSPRPESTGIAICSTSGTFLLTDPHGRPTTPALMYDDARAADQRVHIVDADPDRWATSMQPTWALPKLLWLMASVTPTASSTAPTSSRPTSSVTRSPPTRATPSRPATTWSPMPGRTRPSTSSAYRRALFPDVVLPGTELGRTPAGVPVYAGMTDGCAAQIAAGASLPAPGTRSSVRRSCSRASARTSSTTPPARSTATATRRRLAPRRRIEHRRRRTDRAAPRRGPRRLRPAAASSARRRRHLPAHQDR